MKQLKITKSKARKHIPIINEYLKSEDFNFGKFSKTIVETELLVEEKEDYIIGAFQDLERSHVLAMSHLHGRNYAELIAELREEGEEINKIRWLNARRVVSMVQEFENCGKSMQQLVIAGMQGVKNAAFAYNFNPNMNFGNFATSIIRRHIELYIQNGDSIFAELDKEYEEFHSKANNAYCEYCQKNGQLFDLVRFNSKGHIENLFANAKISRCRNEIIKVANCVEWKMVDTAVHLPYDYDERNKFIRSKPFIVQDALYNGECKDFVKVAGCEWFICTVHEEVRIPVLELTDRNSMRNAFESLMEILENLIERKTMSFSEWRAEMGI